MSVLRIYRDSAGLLIQQANEVRRAVGATVDQVLAAPSPWESAQALFDSGTNVSEICVEPALLAPIGSQEIWAAGVTYLRSRTARMEESKATGGDSFYDRIYHAHRPELFYKGNASRCVGPGGNMTLRGDSAWQVPEPELTLVISGVGEIVGYTIGNDLSSRDIEGENPLYLPQAKVWKGSSALGPCIYLSSEPLPAETSIGLKILRTGNEIFSGHTQISQMKQTFSNLVDYLMRYQDFPTGCFLMTGTGIVPPDDIHLQDGDLVRITIESIGTLENRVYRSHIE